MDVAPPISQDMRPRDDIAYPMCPQVDQTPNANGVTMCAEETLQVFQCLATTRNCAAPLVLNRVDSLLIQDTTPSIPVGEVCIAIGPSEPLE